MRTEDEDQDHMDTASSVAIKDGRSLSTRVKLPQRKIIGNKKYQRNTLRTASTCTTRTCASVLKSTPRLTRAKRSLHLFPAAAFSEANPVTRVRSRNITHARHARRVIASAKAPARSPGVPRAGVAKEFYVSLINRCMRLRGFTISFHSAKHWLTVLKRPFPLCRLYAHVQLGAARQVRKALLNLERGEETPPVPAYGADSISLLLRQRVPIPFLDYPRRELEEIRLSSDRNI
ncbi:hypothetical protein EVAR_16400_1 [Eumeta japonica]|uniref:Uncharacterized protein n=1 Tax=Eumeta variegata TaxID=151549 RepID=A0A4C1VWK4_EUMVA|nr:hypothetical protein EVAR_16400_1 [Eumeta japonica]